MDNCISSVVMFLCVFECVFVFCLFLSAFLVFSWLWAVLPEINKWWWLWILYVYYVYPYNVIMLLYVYLILYRYKDSHVVLDFVKKTSWQLIFNCRVYKFSQTMSTTQMFSDGFWKQFCLHGTIKLSALESFQCGCAIKILTLTLTRHVLVAWLLHFCQLIMMGLALR